MRHIQISLLATWVVSFLTMALGQTAPNDAMAIVRHAYELQQAGDYAGAVEAYRQFLRLRPDEVGAHSNLGVVLTKLGRFEEAITEYQTAQKLLPGDERITVNLALAYEKSGRLAEARRQLQAAHRAAPGQKQIILLLADCYLQQGDDNDVITLLQPVEQQSPEDLAVAYMLGTALIRKQRIAEGQVLLDRILRNGDSAEARFLLGTRMYQSGDYPAAVKELASAIELDAKLPEAQAYYGLALLNTGDPDGAAAAFRNELALNPNNYAANLGLAQIFVVRNQFAEALPLAQRAKEARSQSTDALLTLGECLSGTGRFSEARELLERVARSLPDSLEAHQALATVYTRLHLVKESQQERATVARLQRLEEAHGEGGPKLDEVAPDFELPDAASGSLVSLRQFRGKTPVVLVFGSYSCPNFRSSAEALKQLQQKYGQRAPFYLIYIREAHTRANWQSTRNTREHLEVAAAANLEEKEQHAVMCTKTLHLNFPALVDRMDGAVEAHYAAWPSRAFVIARSGRVLYSTHLTELDFHASDMESALQKAIANK